MYVGQDNNGVLKIGTYETATGSLTTSIGGDAGLLIALSNSSVDNISGWTSGSNLGLDTPIIDAYGGVESFNNEASGGILNISVTLGFEPSSGAVIGGDVTENKTWNQIWWQSDR